MMGWSSPNEESRADHYRDSRKNHIDDVPLRLQPGPLSTAMDIALIVRGMSNLQEAGKLIEMWAESKASQQRLDAVAAGARP